MAWNWSNVPLPPQYVAGLAIGGALEMVFGSGPFLPRWIGIPTGLILLMTGLAIVVWAVRAAGTSSLVRPTGLVTTGPYAYSRNPMYVGWALLYLGISIPLQSAWLIACFPFLLVWTHYFDIRSEEHGLQELFGAEYRQYADRVGRYL
ncbi:MAG: isoprenylcysteine carboxylmethyltransferase family protein [Anaerolineales bacterium]